LIEAGELRIDKEAHRVTVGGEEISLTALEFKLLVTLTERRDRVQARGTLLSDVWAIDAKSFHRTVDTHVKRLRDKLAPRAGSSRRSVAPLSFQRDAVRGGSEQEPGKCRLSVARFFFAPALPFPASFLLLPFSVFAGQVDWRP